MAYEDTSSLLKCSGWTFDACLFSRVKCQGNGLAQDFRNDVSVGNVSCQQVSHVHLLPFKDEAGEIVAEDKLTRIRNLSDLKGVFEREGKYLFFSIGDDSWTVDLALGEPRFFRDRFARALGVSERGNWKEIHSDKKIMSIANEEIMRLEKRWKKYTAA